MCTSKNYVPEDQLKWTAVTWQQVALYHPVNCNFLCLATGFPFDSKNKLRPLTNSKGRQNKITPLLITSRKTNKQYTLIIIIHKYLKVSLTFEKLLNESRIGL